MKDLANLRHAARRIAPRRLRNALTACLTLALVLVAGTANAQLSDNLIGYWPFDGNGDDLSGAGRDVDLFGGVGFDQGLFGQALDLHGNPDQYAERPINDPIYNFGSSDFTISVWANFNSFQAPLAHGGGTIIEKFVGDRGPSWVLTMRHDLGQLHFFANDGALIFNSNFPAADYEQWHHMLVRRDGSDVSLFFNSRLVGFTSFNAPFDSVSAPLLIGRHSLTDPRDFSTNGRIDEVAIWDRGLTDDEIAHLYNSGSGNPVLETQLFPSDLTRNGFVDFEDLTVLLANWNKQVGADAGNLVNPTTTPVNFEDLTVLLADWTGPGPAGSPEAALAEAQAVPEPSALLLAMFAAFGLSACGWRRRRDEKPASHAAIPARRASE